MRKLLFLIAIIVISLSPVSGSQIKLANSGGNDLGYIPDEIVVKTRPVKQTIKSSISGVAQQNNIISTLNSIPRLSGAKITKKLNLKNCSVIKLPNGVGVKEAIKLMKARPEVAWVQPVYIVKPLTLSAPNDYYWGRTYYDDLLGFSEISWPYMWNMTKIQAHEGWNIWPGQYFTAATKPTDAIKVGMIDTGIDPDHPDFINAGGTSSDSSLGGQINWELACKFITDTSNPSNPTFETGIDAATDAYGHGTHVGGIIAAAGNNSIGVIGVGYNSQIVPVRIFTTDTAGRLIGRDDDLANAIKYCADQNLPIINLSVGTTSYSYLIAEAVNYAYYKGCLIIAAANEGNPPATLGKIYPAANSKVLGVSPTGIDDDFPSIAADGYAGSGDYIGISAPSGGQKIFYIDFGDGDYIELPWYTPIWSTVPTYPVDMTTFIGSPLTDIYALEIGTSMATPHVSGLAALYADKNGYSASTHGGNLAIWRAIQRGADNPYGGPDIGYDENYGFGRINVYNTLRDLNTRDATMGSVSGQVFKDGLPQAGVPLKITNVANSSIIYQTTTQEFGFWRIPNIPAGIYNVKNIASVALTKEIKYVDVLAGCDTPGLDLYLGPVDYQLDDTPPSSPEIVQDAPVGNTLHAKWWSVDLESGIFKYEVAIGTTPGGVNIMPWTNEGWRTEYTFNIAAAGGNKCYVSVRSTNGAGLLSSEATGGFASITGKITLANYNDISKITTIPITVEIYNLAGGSETKVIYLLDSDGNFKIDNIAPGTYDLYFKASHWLAKKVHVVVN